MASLTLSVALCLGVPDDIAIAFLPFLHLFLVYQWAGVPHREQGIKPWTRLANLTWQQTFEESLP